MMGDIWTQHDAGIPANSTGVYGNRNSPTPFGQNMADSSINYGRVSVPMSKRSSSGDNNVGNLGLGDTTNTTAQTVIGPLMPQTSLVDSFLLASSNLVSNAGTFFNSDLVPNVPNWALALGAVGFLLLVNRK